LGAAVGVQFGEHDDRVVCLLDEALDALGGHDGPLRARVLACLGLALAWSAPERRDAVSQEAVAVARRVGDEVALAGALMSRHFVLWGAGDLHERLAIATEMIGLAVAAGDVEAELRARVHRMGDLWELGCMEEAEAERDTFARLAERLRQPYYLWWAAVVRVMRPLLEGRFEEVEQLAQQALVLGQRARDPNALQFLGTHMFALRWAQGRLEEIADQIEAFAQQYAGLPVWRCGVAFLHAELGHAARARMEFEQVARKGFD